MGVEEVAKVICQGVLEKKCDNRRIPIGPTWKRKYCVLSSDAVRLYRSKSKAIGGFSPLRTIPFCHIKSVSRVFEEDENKTNYFKLVIEQGETLLLRYKGETGWVAQIQIQLIHHKNRQDILRYKQLNNSMAAAESAIQRLRASNPNDTDVKELSSHKGNLSCATRGCKTVVLPIHRNSGMGIGITVIPLYDGRVVVNRVLEGGPAMQLGVIQPRDQIISANGHRVTSVEMLSEVVRTAPETVTLMVKPRIARPSPDLEDPKKLLKQDDHPEYINTDASDGTAMLLSKGFGKERYCLSQSPKHFKFS